VCYHRKYKTNTNVCLFINRPDNNINLLILILILLLLLVVVVVLVKLVEVMTKYLPNGAKTTNYKMSL